MEHNTNRRVSSVSRPLADLERRGLIIKKEGKSEKEAYKNRRKHYFFVPSEARWSASVRLNKDLR